MKKKINTPKAKSNSPKKVAKPKRISSYNKLKAEIAKLQEDKINMINEIFVLLRIQGSFEELLTVKVKYRTMHQNEISAWLGEPEWIEE